MKMGAFHLPHSETPHDAGPGMALLAAMTVEELSDAVTPAQARGFFLAIGRRMAACETMDGVKDAAVLCGRINAFWEPLGWGEAEIALHNDAIVIRHRYAPKLIEGNASERWPNMLLALLEGAYDFWFRQLGSGPSLKTSAEWKGDTVELRHGA